MLDESNSQVYLSRGAPKHARLHWQPRVYTLTWGEQTFDGPHMVIGHGAEQYGCDLQVFFTTYQPVNEEPHHYRKVAKVRAMQVTTDTDITSIVRGKTEMTATIKPGGWLLQNATGEVYYNTAEAFAEQYVLEPND